MKKSLFVICAVAIALSTIGCSKKDKPAAASTDAVSALKARGTFVLGLDASFPPLGYTDDDGTIVGYDIDLAKEVAKRMGVSFKAQPIDWDAKEMELNTNKIDCIWNGFTITEDRKEALSFTPAYLNNEQVLIVRADSGIKTLADMKGKVVGLQSGSSAQEAVEANKAFADSLKETVYYKENVSALNDLEIGGVDGVVMDSVVGAYAIKTTGKNFVIVSEALANEEYGIGFRKSEPELRDAVWTILKEMQADGTVANICAKWFSQDISVIK
ncbi:MAG: amino acid ABC transporter substrate-binding protein [Treponema sp.]|nr:amino acid ABC transporter substrate-binding protein [Treponema sp.]